MPNTLNHEVTTRDLMYRAGLPLLLTWSLIPLTFVFPLVDSTRPPYFDLTQTLPEMAYWFAESGGVYGSTIVSILLLVLLVTRGEISRSRRATETGVFLLIGGIFAGGGAVINEHVIKEQLEIPRPNIVWLAGENGNGPLGMTPNEFYESGDKEARRKPLCRTLGQSPAPVALSPLIKSHWIQETGYSFPSGHAFSAMFFATFLLLTGATYLTTNRLALFYLLLPWALLICYSRPILRVHTPADITFGGLQGLLVGLLAWAIARTMIRRFSSQDISS